MLTGACTVTGTSVERVGAPAQGRALMLQYAAVLAGRAVLLALVLHAQGSCSSICQLVLHRPHPIAIAARTVLP